jgi:GT2 family glycosyltransferase/SAM-dependent methyltransferase
MSQTSASEPPPWRPRVSIVLVTRNYLERTQQCLVHIATNTPGDLYELIVVDDGSCDGTDEWLKALEGDVRVLRNDSGQGAIAAWNEGVSVAVGDYVVLLESSILPQSGWLEGLLEQVETAPAVGIVSPGQIEDGGSRRAPGLMLMPDLTLAPAADNDDLECCAPAALLVRRDLWHLMGGLDGRFATPEYAVADFCLRAWATGERVAAAPSALVAVAGEQSTTAPPIDRNALADRWLGITTSAERRTLIYRCNLCSGPCATPMRQLERDNLSCPTCLSHARARAIVHVLSTELFGRSLSLPDFPLRKDLVGIGMSDLEAYAVPLSKRLGYTNTLYNRPPFLDITALDASMVDKFDFVICADVMEHVVPPVEPAFVNLRRLLKDTGVLIFTVPYRPAPWTETEEHYPDLHDFSFNKTPDGKTVMVNRTREGVVQHFPDPVFHGGEGLCLEMRIYAEQTLLAHLRDAGFEDITIYREPAPSSGVMWDGWHAGASLPIAARPKAR